MFSARSMSQIYDITKIFRYTDKSNLTKIVILVKINYYNIPLSCNTFYYLYILFLKLVNILIVILILGVKRGTFLLT